MEKGWIVPLEDVSSVWNLWNTPLVTALKVSGGKKEDDIWLCMDLRGVNAKSEAPNYQLSMIADLIFWIRGLKIFFELDLLATFHQIKLSKDSQVILGFTGLDGKQYIWMVMPFDPKEAATHFQWVIDSLVANFLNFLRVYVDNLLAHSQSVKDHIDHLKVVIETLTKVGFKLNLKKSKFEFTRIWFMGMIVDDETQWVAKDKLGWLKKITRPTSRKKVFVILGFFNFFKDFISNYTRVAAPLEEIRKKKVITEKHWKLECQKIFQDLKILLESAPPLSQLNFDKEFLVVTNTSQFGIEVVLYQKIKGKIKYIDFGGGSLKDSQKNYPAVKQELLVIIFALKR